jgi:lysophospholipase L1-like esterase
MARLKNTKKKAREPDRTARTSVNRKQRAKRASVKRTAQNLTSRKGPSGKPAAKRRAHPAGTEIETPRRARGPAARGMAREIGRRKAHVVSFEKALAGQPGDVPSQAEYDWCILAESDSWFSMGAIPSTNLTTELRFARSAIVVNAAYPGDTIRHMSEISDNQPLRKMLVERNFAFEWDLILLSGGGNDLIDAALSLVVAPPVGVAGSINPADCVNHARLATLVEDVQAGYRRIAALREASEIPANRGIPIVVHTYDYPTPRNSPAKFVGIPVRGPWLFPALNSAGVFDPTLRQAISDYLLRALGDGIAALEAGPGAIANFHVVKTRDTLERAQPGATGSSGDWQNEIHPNVKGYKKLGERLVAASETLPRHRP